MKVRALTLILGGLLGASSLHVLAETDNRVYATVNGAPITHGMVRAYQEQKDLSMGVQKIRNEGELDVDGTIAELVAMELLYQDAVNQGLDKLPEVESQLAWTRRSLLTKAALQNVLLNDPVSDEELKDYYDELLSDRGNSEYHARHILLSSAADAEAVIAELDAGADFAALAKEKSTGPSGPKGGDLGWFNLTQMVPEFSAAVREMAKGQYSKSPVSTQFGYHVIKLEDTRKATPPSFESVKDRLRQDLQKKRLEAHLGELKEAARVVMKAR